MTRTNEFGQAIGEKLPVGWKEPIIPDKKTLLGNYTRVEPLDVTKHANELFTANNSDFDASYQHRWVSQHGNNVPDGNLVAPYGDN